MTGFITTIYIIIIVSGLTAAYFVLFRDMMRFNIYLTTAIMALAYTADNVSDFSFSPICGNSILITLVYLMSVAVAALLIQTDKILDMLIIYFFFTFIYNIIGTLLVAILTVVYGAIQGADASTWFSFESSTDADILMRSIATLITSIVSIIICRRCMFIILNADSRLKLPLLMGTTVPMVIFVAARDFLYYDTEQMLEGPAVICYGLLLLLVSVSLFVFFVNVFFKAKEENKLIQIQVDLQNMQYQRVLKIQQELRETKHDLANQLVAYKLSQQAKSTPDK